MRHNDRRFQLNRFTSWRKATVLSLARNVLIRQRIQTTKNKAKAVQPVVEKLITLAKENTLSAKRQAFSMLQDHALVSVLFNDIGTRFKNISGGYTRVLLLGNRRGDNATMAILELTKIVKKEPQKPKKIKASKPQDTVEELEQTTTPGEKIAKPHAHEPKAETAVKEKPPITKKPTKSFLGGIKSIFKKERDSL